MCTLDFRKVFNIPQIDIFLFCFEIMSESGIRQWPINLCTSPMMMIHKKIPLSVDYNQWLKVETFGWTLNLMNQPTKIQ